MSKIKGLAIRGEAAGQGVQSPEPGPRIGGQPGPGHHILGDIFGRIGDTQRGTQYLFNRIPFRNWGRVEGSHDPGA